MTFETGDIIHNAKTGDLAFIILAHVPPEHFESWRGDNVIIVNFLVFESANNRRPKAGEALGSYFYIESQEILKERGWQVISPAWRWKEPLTN